MESEKLSQIPEHNPAYPVDLLIPYARNARTHSEAQIAQIAASIREFGFTNAVLIDGNDGIIAGHGRVLAAMKLGMHTVPVIRLAYLSDDQKRAYIIADNKLALNAGWDDEMLKLELESLRLVDFDLGLIGFDEGELLDIFGSTPAEGLTEDDEVPALSADPAITQPGDIWVMGRHRLMCGDSTNMEAVGKLMDGLLADMLLTDPPYNVAVQGGDHGDPGRKNGKKIQNDSMADAEFSAFLADAFIAADTVMKKGAVFYIWHSATEGLNFISAVNSAKLELKQVLVWVKNSIVMGRQDYQWQHEPCLYGWKSGAAHLWAADRKQTTVLKFDRPQRNDIHPTMKPVALFEYQMLNNTKGSDIVLDLFGGSGTTLIACQKNGRVAHLMELDPKYCDVIVKRWEEFTGEKAVLAD